MKQFLKLILFLFYSNTVKAQEQTLFGCIPIQFFDTIPKGNGEYYYQQLFPTGSKSKCYGQFIKNALGEKIPYGKHLRYYFGSLIDENREKINQTDTTKISNIFQYDSFGNLQWDILFNYSDRKIQSVYYSPPHKEKNNKQNDCLLHLLTDTIMFEGGEYYFTDYEENYTDDTRFSKRHYGRFRVNNNGNKIPYGKHFTFYDENEPDEYKEKIINFDPNRVQIIEYYENTGICNKTVGFYYTSRSINFIVFIPYLKNDVSNQFSRRSIRR